MQSIKGYMQIPTQGYFNGVPPMLQPFSGMTLDPPGMGNVSDSGQCVRQQLGPANVGRNVGRRLAGYTAESIRLTNHNVC